MRPFSLPASPAALACLVLACDFSVPSLPETAPAPAPPEAAEPEAIEEVEAQLDTGPPPPAEPVPADAARIATLDKTLRAQLPSGDLDPVLADLRAIDLQLNAAPGDAESHVKIKAQLAHAALRAGRPQLARRVAKAAFELETDALAEVAWWGGLGSYQVDDAEGVQAAAAHCTGTRQQVLQALALEARGQRSEAIAAFPTTVRGNEDSALAYIEMARIDTEQAVVWLRRAVESADRGKLKPLQIRTRLDLESIHRERQDYSRAAATRSALARLARTDAMKAELAARALLAGDKRQSFPSGEQPDLITLWASLRSGDAPPADTQAALCAPILSWARGRDARRSALTGTEYYSAALSTLPTHRQGRLSAGTALDGSMGLPTSVELEEIAGSSKIEDLNLALAIHEMGHRMDHIRANQRAGRHLLHGLDNPTKRALLSTTARARAQLDLWLSGNGAYPEEAFARLAAKEAQAASDPLFARLLPSPGPDIETLRAELRENNFGLISYQRLGYRLHALALSSHGSFMGTLGEYSEATRLAQAHVQTMANRALRGGTPDPVPGHQLRAQIFDPLEPAFLSEGSDEGGGAKIGKYRVIAPESLRGFHMGSLSVNRAGHQVLGRSQTFYAYPSFRSLDPHDRSQPMTIPTVFLGMALSGQPDDLRAAAAHFGSLGQVQTGTALTAETFLEGIAEARYIYLSELPAGPNGGFQVYEGLVGLDAIARTPLRAELVLVRSMAPHAQQLARAQAFLEAGAQMVLVLGWEIPAADIESLLPAFLAEASDSPVNADRMAFELKRMLDEEGEPGQSRYGMATRGAFLLWSSP